MLETVIGTGPGIEENRSKDLILIDTPGLPGFTEIAESSTLARFLRRAPISIRNWRWRLPSSRPTRANGGCLRIFKPQRLVFTKLDETSSFGPIFNEAVRTGKPLSFFATGSGFPKTWKRPPRAGLPADSRTGIEQPGVA